MPSQPPEPSCGFGPALDIIDVGQDSKRSCTPSPPVQSHNEDRTVKRPTTLGDFRRIWCHLGISKGEPPPDADPETEDQSNTDDALLTPLDDSNGRSGVVEDASSDASGTDDVPRHSFAEMSLADGTPAGMTKKEQFKAHLQAEKTRKQAEVDWKQARKKQKKLAKIEKKHVALQHRLAWESEEITSSVATRTRSKVAAMHLSATLTVPEHPTPIEGIRPSRIPRPQFMLQRSGIKPIGPSSVQDGGTAPSYPFPVQKDHSSALAKLDALLKTQYTTVGTPIPMKNLAPIPTVWGEKPDPKPRHTPATLGTIPSTPVRTAFTPVLIPSTVRPQPPTSRKSEKKRSEIFSTISQADRNFEFLKKLIEKFPEDQESLVSPRRLLFNEGTSPEGIHIFIDASNILIGFNEMQKRRGYGSGRFPMSFDCLALLLERRRPVAKRIYAGSTRVTAPVASNERFNELAGSVGYEKNIYEQVHKIKELTDSQKFFKDVDKSGWQKATAMRSSDKQEKGSGNSDSETGAGASSPSPTPKWVEQGVDETLHLKMCQSLLDADGPSTMVLATGDGAQAEYSDGFLAHVERALKCGWAVEVVSWKQQLSSGYKNRQFRAKWGEMFKIIELDEFIEFMVDV